MKALTPTEVLQVLKATAVPRDTAMICLAFKHGLRASEVCGLRLSDVDLKNGQLTIRRLKLAASFLLHARLSATPYASQRSCGSKPEATIF